MGIARRTFGVLVVAGLAAGCGSETPQVVEPTTTSTSTVFAGSATEPTTSTSSTTTTSIVETTTTTVQVTTTALKPTTTTPRVTTPTLPLIPAKLTRPEDGYRSVWVQETLEFNPLIHLLWEPSPHAVSESLEIFDCANCHWFNDEADGGIILAPGEGPSTAWPHVFSWRIISEYADGRTIASETWSIEFQMLFDYIVHGEVSDAVTGEPIDGASASWTDALGELSEDTYNGGFFAHVHYDSKVAPPPTIITISADGYESQQILGEIDDVTHLIRLHPITP